MKRVGWGILAFIFGLNLPLPVGALDTVPTTPNKVTSPLLVTSYSFNGPNVRYVQIYNNSSNLQSLDGWNIVTTTKTAPIVSTPVATLAGLLEPGRHVFAAVSGVVDRVSFSLPPYTPASSPLIGSIALVAPDQSGFNDEIISVPTITTSSLKEIDGVQSNYYLKRDVSTTTGNYLSGFTFILPSEKLKNDSLYIPSPSPLVQIAELYPDAITCSPFDTATTCADYVKIQNISTASIDLAQFRLRTGIHGQAASSSNSRQLSGSLASGQYVSFPLALSSTGSWVWLEDTYGIVKYDTTVVEYPTTSSHDYQSWAYDHTRGIWDWTEIPTPHNAPSVFPQLPSVQDCSELRINEVAANVASEDQFVELVNVASEPVAIGGCMLQTNRSATISYVFPEGILVPGEYKTIYIKDTPLTLTKTTTGEVYLLSSDMQSEADSVEYRDMTADTSLVFIDGVWKQTYQLTPGALNSFMEFAACSVGAVRNIDTGLCNKIQVASVLEECGEGKIRSPETNRCRSAESSSTLVACDNDQYRSIETNRCRSLVTTTSMLAPCASNQERNSETNRCRSVGSANELKPCAANQERNQETNRCRTVGSSIAADFPVEAVAQSGEATMGWWAFGGVGTLAAGYAGWEWRREALSWIKKVLPFGIGSP